MTIWFKHPEKLLGMFKTTGTHSLTFPAIQAVCHSSMVHKRRTLPGQQNYIVGYHQTAHIYNKTTKNTVRYFKLTNLNYSQIALSMNCGPLLW